MKFSKLSNFLETLEKTSSRIEITKILSELFANSSDLEIKNIAYILVGSIAPSYEGVIFGIAEKNIIQVLSLYSNKTPDEINTLYKKIGDLGSVVNELATNHGKDQDLKEVFNELEKISKIEGDGSVEIRNDLVVNLLKSNSSESNKYIVRILLGRLRLGFSELTIIDALSWMLVGDKSLKGQIQKHYEVVPDIGEIAYMIKKEGKDFLKKEATPIFGIPVSPMLASRLKSPDEMVEKMGKVSVEPKFDGVRVLIHIKKNPVQIKAFTRNLKNISPMFPELKSALDFINAKEVILDSEAVGLTEDMKKMVDFQTTMQRRRKHDIEGVSQKIPIFFQVFDVLYIDGKNLMQETYEVRRSELKKVINTKGVLKIDEHLITDDPKEISNEFTKRIKEGLEGIMVKKIDSLYVPGRTGFRWVKMKDEVSGKGKLSDTVDCVIMGFSVGRGKRATLGMGQFLVGVKDGDEFKTVTKVGTGLSDDLLMSLSKDLEKIKTKLMPKEYLVPKDLIPDVWVEPKVVVEISADEITVSPKHTSGYALRFPRLINVRDDKSPKESTTITELRNIQKLAH